MMRIRELLLYEKIDILIISEGVRLLKTRAASVTEL